MESILTHIPFLWEIILTAYLRSIVPRALGPPVPGCRREWKRWKRNSIAGVRFKLAQEEKLRYVGKKATLIERKGGSLTRKPPLRCGGGAAVPYS